MRQLHLSAIFLFVVTTVVFAGPIWPETFRVDFKEMLYGRLITYSENEGTWYYDVANNRARFDHLKGQTDNFCQGQGLSPTRPRDDCHLLFSPDTAMYVHYPNHGTCCRLCAPGIGCSPLRPDWIVNGTYEGIENVEGRDCSVYHEKGAVAQDYWMETMDERPCRYFESLPDENPYFFHNLTFYPDTYSTEPIDDKVFEVPDYCYKDCRHPYTPPDSKHVIF